MKIDRDVPVARKPAAGQAFSLDDARKIPQELLYRELLVVIDGLGAAITTGVKGDTTLHFPCTVTGWKLVADQSGSIQVDVWRDKFANFPPTVADSITAGSPPLLSSAASGSGTSLGWSRQLKAGDVLRFNVDSASTVTRVTLALSIKG